MVKISAPYTMAHGEIMRIFEKNQKEIQKLYERDQRRQRGHMLFGRPVDPKKYPSKEALERLYRQEFPPFLEEVFEKVRQRTGLREKEHRIRKMKIRWGTCYPQRGLILINLKAAALSPREIEYIVLHEMIHLKIPHHGKEFYQALEKYMEDYREIDERLRL